MDAAKAQAAAIGDPDMAIGGRRYEYSKRTSSDAFSESYSLCVDGSYSATSSSTALLEGICGSSDWKGTWSVGDDGVTVLIDGKALGKFDRKTGTITSESEVYRRR